MAILVRGKSKCPICGRVIADEDEAALFPHFVLNEADPLYSLSDAACHTKCMKSHPLGLAMFAASEQCLASTGPGKRICEVCGEEVQDLDEYIIIGYLYDRKDSPLGNFNYTHLHRSHIKFWKRANEFLALADNALATGRWRGPTLAKLVSEVEAGISDA